MLSSPDEVSTVRAEGGLTEEGGHELVVVDLVDFPPHGPPAVDAPGMGSRTFCTKGEHFSKYF